MKRVGFRVFCLKQKEINQKEMFLKNTFERSDGDQQEKSSIEQKQYSRRFASDFETSD